MTEHHFTKIGQLSAPLTLLTYLAARTTRLRLGTAILVLPWHNPVLLAKQVATLDLLSRGRLDLGIGKGYRHNEFAGFALPPADAEPRFEEMLDVIVRALGSDAPFSHRGAFFRFDEIVVEPPPYQRPHPPLWLAAGSAASITACARRGFNLLLDQFASPLQIKERIALYRRELEAAGHAFDPMRVAVARNIFVAEDASESAEARKRQERVHERLLSLSRGSESRPGSHILGYTEPSTTPSRCGATLPRRQARPTASCRTICSATFSPNPVGSEFPQYLPLSVVYPFRSADAGTMECSFLKGTLLAFERHAVVGDCNHGPSTMDRGTSKRWPRRANRSPSSSAPRQNGRPMAATRD